jgi:hypothetical protein
VKLAKFDLDLGLFAVNQKRVFRHLRKIVAQQNVVIYGNVTTGKKKLAKELSDIQIEWDSGKEPMLKFRLVGEASLHVALYETYYYTPYQIAKFLELVRSHNKKFILIFINEIQMRKYLHMLNKYDYVVVNTGEKLLSETDKVGWFKSYFRPPFIESN